MKKFFLQASVPTLAFLFVFGCAKEEKRVESRRPGIEGKEVRQTLEKKRTTEFPEPWQISTGAGYFSFPAWSPDGRRLAYTAGQEGQQDIWVVELDEDGRPKGAPVNITNSTSMDEHPSWSPEGDKIVFHSDREEGKRKLFVVDADGNNPGLLYEHQTKEGLRESFNPSWSPDGEWIAFVADNNIWVIDKEGKKEPRFLTSFGYNDHPSWSPDGSWLAFYSGNAIRLVEANGGEERKLTGLGGMKVDFPGWSGYPSWSPDGKKIAFVSNKKKICEGKEVKYYDIWVVNSDGTGEAKYLTNDKYRECFPVWSPQGDKLAFQSNRQGDFHIWVISLPTVFPGA